VVAAFIACRMRIVSSVYAFAWEAFLAELSWSLMWRDRMLVDLIGFFPFIILFVVYLFVKFHPQKMHDPMDRKEDDDVLLPMSADSLSTGHDKQFKKMSTGVLIEKEKRRSAE
jgi:hypothetical protein